MKSRRTRLILIVAILLQALPGILVAGVQELSKSRMWTGKNGHTFRGVFLIIDETTKKYRFLNETRNKPLLIDPANLSKKDLDFIQRHLSEAKKKPDAAGAANTFLPDGALNRLTIPLINQSDYGNKASDCVPSSFCNFLLWWDQSGYLPIDRRGDFEKKAEWVHSRAGRYFKTRNNSGTSRDDAREGIKTYFENHLKELATFRVNTFVDCSPANLAKYTQGARATFLEVTIFHRGRNEGSHWVALVDAKPNGEVLMHTWGIALRGKLKLIKADVETTAYIGRTARRTTANHYSIEFINPPGGLPQWMVDQEVTFQIDPKNQDFLTVLAPYRYAVKGKISPPPVDPLTEDPLILEGKQRVKKQKAIEIPAGFVTYDDSVRYTRSWSLNGKPVKAVLSGVADGSVLLRVPGGSKKVPLVDLNAADKAAVKLWQGVAGTPESFNEGELVYRFKTPSNPNITVRIQVKGDKFRITTSSSTKAQVQDLATGEYVGYHVYQGKKPSLYYYGKLKPAELCAPPRDSIHGRKTWQTFLDDTRNAKFVTTQQWPARKMGYPDAYQKRTSKIDVRFSLMNNSSIVSALDLMLGSYSGKYDANKSGGLVLFSMKSMIGNSQISDLCAHLRMAKAVPVALSWKNNSKYASPKYDKIYQGHYSLVLESMDESPLDDELFNIPAEAKEVAPGNMVKVK